jgi:hypothetical protein
MVIHHHLNGSVLCLFLLSICLTMVFMAFIEPYRYSYVLLIFCCLIVLLSCYSPTPLPYLHPRLAVVVLEATHPIIPQYRVSDVDFRMYFLALFLLIYFLSVSSSVLEREYIGCAFNCFSLINGIS